MEHVKVHFKIAEPGADLLNRLQQDLDEDDAGLACDICEPIYQQLFLGKKMLISCVITQYDYSN